MKEIWKKVPDYPSYMISDLGNVTKGQKKYDKDNNFLGYILLKPHTNKGYKRVKFTKDGRRKHFTVHQLVAMAFLGHKLDGTTKLVVDHINTKKTDNRLSNLQIISNRENCSKNKKDVGVSWIESRKSYFVSININGKTKYLGRTKDKEEALELYAKALNKINKTK